jgi:hypothetical protein
MGFAFAQAIQYNRNSKFESTLKPFNVSQVYVGV